jgi:prolipoprotein diacylglyceryltransferase
MWVALKEVISIFSLRSQTETKFPSGMSFHGGQIGGHTTVQLLRPKVKAVDVVLGQLALIILPACKVFM